MTPTDLVKIIPPSRSGKMASEDGFTLTAVTSFQTLFLDHNLSFCVQRVPMYQDQTGWILVWSSLYFQVKNIHFSPHTDLLRPEDSLGKCNLAVSLSSDHVARG